LLSSCPAFFSFISPSAHSGSHRPRWMSPMQSFSHPPVDI
jgi:hypothetical protein